MNPLLPKDFDCSKFILSSKGQINYAPSRPSQKFSGEHICVVDTDEDLSAFYRWMWTKQNPHLPILKPSWNSHISIMRGERILNNGIPWKYRDGELVEFSYSPEIIDDGVHVWINTYCEAFFELRHRYNVPIKYNTGHITIGKLK